MSEEEKSENAPSPEKKGENQPSPRGAKMIAELRDPLPSLPLKDKNWSNVVFVLILGYMVGMTIYLVFGNTFGKALTGGSRIGFLLLPILLGNLLGAIGWLLGKMLFGAMCGYELTFFCLSGLCYEKHRDVANSKGKKSHFYFNYSYLLEVHANFAPKKRNIDANPTLMLLGGYIGWIIIFTVLLVIGLIPGINNEVLKEGAFFCAIQSVEFLIYQIMPFRQDYPNDAYTFRTTRKKAEREAFNAYSINAAYEFADQDLIVVDHDPNDNSYWQARQLSYEYDASLYKGDLDKCFSLLSKAQQVSKFYNEEELAYFTGERLFILLSLNDRNGADMILSMQKKDIKNKVLKPYRLASYRNSLLVKGLMLNNEDDSIAIANKFYSFKLSDNSARFRQEKRYFKNARSVVLNIHPKFNIPSEAENN